VNSSACLRPASARRSAHRPESGERRSSHKLVSLPSAGVSAPKRTSSSVERASKLVSSGLVGLPSTGVGAPKRTSTGVERASKSGWTRQPAVDRARCSEEHLLRRRAGVEAQVNSSACPRPESACRSVPRPASSERRSSSELVSVPSIALDAPRSTSCDVGRALDMRRVGSQPASVIQRAHQRASSWLSPASSLRRSPPSPSGERSVPSHAPKSATHGASSSPSGSVRALSGP
jgi:hypothetical protein